MRIAVLLEQFTPAAGGRERSTRQIVRELIARGHRVTILANAASSDALEHVPGAELDIAGGTRTKYAVGLRRFVAWSQDRLDRGDFDVSLAMTIAVPASVVQPREGVIAEMISRKLVMDRHRPAGWLKAMATRVRLKNRAWLELERRTLAHPRVRRVVAISAYVRQSFIHHHGVEEDRLCVIPNAAEVLALDADSAAASRERTRRDLRLEPEDAAFLFVSTEPHRKGLAQLIAAFAELVKQAPAARLVIVGLNDRWPRRRIRGLGLEDRVRWVGPTREIDRYYQAADVTVLPSWYDPASKVVLESLLHGLPTIGALTDGSSQWIFDSTGERMPPSPFDANRPPIARSDHPQGGRVIDSPANIEALTQAMAELIPPAERRRCSQASRGIGRFITMKAHVEQLEQVLRTSSQA